MSTLQTLTYLDVAITSPADGSRVKGTSVTVTGTAAAARETIDTDQDAQTFPDPIGPGPLPGGSSTIPLPGSSDEVQDITASIQKVEVKIETGSGTGQFQPATPKGPADKPFATWTFTGTLPLFFRQAVITAQVTLGNRTESTLIRVLGLKVPILART